VSTKEIVSIEGKQLKLSNLDKVLYPSVGFTKGQVLDYYTQIAPVMLPHLAGRPLTLKRYPEGVEGNFFYEKQCPSHRPRWVKLKSVPRESQEGTIDYCVIQNLPTLIWVANLASLEMHVLLSREPTVSRPTMMMFDLDPGPPATILDSARLALKLRDFLQDLGLQSFAKTSGGKGIHLAVPLNTRVTFEQIKLFAQAIAQLMERFDPRHVTSKMSKSLRAGKVFVDWSQNDSHKTTVCVYSLRARERPTVSTPVKWEEVQDAVRTDDAEMLTFESHEVLKRVEKHGDLFEPLLTVKQTLPKTAALGETSTA
jgi:bifunctional non-homologous end joining protein LigD